LDLREGGRVPVAALVAIEGVDECHLGGAHSGVDHRGWQPCIRRKRRHKTLRASTVGRVGLLATQGIILLVDVTV